MSKIALVVTVLACVSVAACAQPDPEPTFRSFDLDVSHPSPHATFIAVSPGARGEKLPRVRHLNSKGFNTYLRDLTGCAVDQQRKTHVIGHKRAPAGYMIPVICMGATQAPLHGFTPNAAPRRS